MKKVGEMIRKVRLEKRVTQDELARRIGCAKQTVSNYENGRREPDYETLEAIGDALNVPMTFFLSKEEQRAELSALRGEVPITNALPVETITYIPVMGTVRCGPGGVALQDIDGYLPAVNVKNPSECFYLRVTGDSMTPRIQPGDLALIRKTSEVESGQLDAQQSPGRAGNERARPAGGDPAREARPAGLRPRPHPVFLRALRPRARG